MRLYLVDSSIFVFKSYFTEPRHNRRGQPNQAFVGFVDFVYRLLTEQAPSRVVFAFDESLAQSARKAIYPAYKANRAPAPPELKRQFAWCRQWLDALGLANVSSRYWEADDLIGSLAHYHRRAGLPVAFLTADKDLAQLVEEGDLWWSYLDGRQFDAAAIRKKFGVDPGQIAEQLALVGDKVDNIPGVPEIGPKTAARLLRKFGSIAELRRRVDEVSNLKIRYAERVRQSLIEHDAMLDTWLALTRINCEIDAMRDVDGTRAAPVPARLERMMRAQDLGDARRDRWREYLLGVAA